MVYIDKGRYAALDTFYHTTKEGKTIAYKGRRLIPRDKAHQKLTIPNSVLQTTNRLDHFAGKYFGDATLFWKICDAKEIIDPFDIEE